MQALQMAGLKKEKGEETNIVLSNSKTWWRSDSPRTERFSDEGAEGGARARTPSPDHLAGVPFSGVFSVRKRPQYQSQYQVGFGPATKNPPKGERPGSVTGYSGFIAGKYAGNVIGTTYSASGFDCENHLLRTSQAAFMNKAGRG